MRSIIRQNITAPAYNLNFDASTFAHRQPMGESAAPFGENEKKRSASRQLFAFPTGSPAYFSTHISLLLVLSKFQSIGWCGNNPELSLLYLREIITKEHYENYYW